MRAPGLAHGQGSRRSPSEPTVMPRSAKSAPASGNGISWPQIGSEPADEIKARRLAVNFAKLPDSEVGGAGLKNAHLTFAHDAFVRFICAFNTILKLTVALRHFFDDGIRASRIVAVVRFNQHDLAYTKFVGSHGEPSQ